MGLTTKAMVLVVGLAVHLSAPPAKAEGSGSLTNKVLAAGVPRDSLLRIHKFLKENHDRDLYQETYDCVGREPGDPLPCLDHEQTRSSKSIRVTKHRYIGVIDFSRPSSDKRLFVIDLKTGDVKKFHVAHGAGSGDNKTASKFSNIKNSNQTALGLYKVGEEYHGSNGPSLRLYGLEKSNDQAYNRNIVFHSAPYAMQANRGEPIGNSNGCPAVSIATRKELLPLLKDGALIDFYHPNSDVMDQSLSGREVEVPR